MAAESRPCAATAMQKLQTSSNHYDGHRQS